MIVHLDCLHADPALVANLELVRLLHVPVHVALGHGLAAVPAGDCRPTTVRGVRPVVGHGHVALAAFKRKWKSAFII